MGLVDYSDSDASDTEIPPKAPAPKAAPAKTTHRVVDRAEPKKIKVDLPLVTPEQDDLQERPAKRARTAGGGAFGGFNSLLPAPKGRVQSGPKPGVSLKTSSEAAFSRASISENLGGPSDASSLVFETNGEGELSKERQEEPKIVGKVTRFKPLSVGQNKKKNAKKPKPSKEADITLDIAKDAPPVTIANGEEGPPQATLAAAPPAPKPKRSLFSVHNEEPEGSDSADGNNYKPITGKDTPLEQPSSTGFQAPPPIDRKPNSLTALASDLNLTSAQRRQLLGRNGKDAGAEVNIAHFNMDSEYTANEKARQSGEAVEHRAVKAIAPGKHSLQQLVNNARTQQGGLEDKWAEGRRERGEAGGKYGWGK